MIYIADIIFVCSNICSENCSGCPIIIIICEATITAPITDLYRGTNIRVELSFETKTGKFLSANGTESINNQTNYINKVAITTSNVDN